LSFLVWGQISIEKFPGGASNRQKKYAKLILVLRLHSSAVEQGTHKPKVASSNLAGAISHQLRNIILTIQPGRNSNFCQADFSFEGDVVLGLNSRSHNDRRNRGLRRIRHNARAKQLGEYVG
jgi:hypothetical protein